MFHVERFVKSRALYWAERHAQKQHDEAYRRYRIKITQAWRKRRMMAREHGAA